MRYRWISPVFLVVLFLIFSVPGLYIPRSWRQLTPAGDEPEYLLITHSILFDGDVKLDNNIWDNHGRFFSHARVEYPWRYPLHGPGLPTLLLPFYAFGYSVAPEQMGALRVCYFAMTLWGVLAGWLAYRAALHISEPGIAAFSTLAIFISVPVYFHVFHIYPAIPAATIILALWLTQQSKLQCYPPLLFLRGLLIAILPFLHIRLGWFALVFTLLATHSLLRKKDLFNTFCFLSPVAAGCCGLAFYSSEVHASIVPWLEINKQTTFTLHLIPRRMLGLLLDVDSGIIPVAPIYLFALIKLLDLRRKQRVHYAQLRLLILPYMLLCASQTMWWGSYCVRGRLLVPFLPLLTIPLAALLQKCSRSLRILIVLTVLQGLVVTLHAINPSPYSGAHPYLYQEIHGCPPLLQSVGHGLPLCDLFPSLHTKQKYSPVGLKSSL